MKIDFRFNCNGIPSIIDLIKKKKITELLKDYEWDYYRTKQMGCPAGSFAFGEKGVPVDKLPHFKDESIDIDFDCFKKLIDKSVDVY